MKIIDGKAIAKSIRKTLKEEISSYLSASNSAGLESDAASQGGGHNRLPGLAVVLVGDDPASRIYVRNKTRALKRVGMVCFDHGLSEATSQDALQSLIDELNADERVDGILVQLPLPPHLDADAIVGRILPDKDVDGFHPVNLGRLLSGRLGHVPCTPLGIVRLLESAGTLIDGANALVIGRSITVGRPVAELLLARNATTTIAHSRTRDLPAICRQADIVIAAVGRAELVRGDWIKPGATVIDVGINRTVEGGLVGDVAFDEVSSHANAITPVPGGVGPMTIAMLLQNTWNAYRLRVDS